MPKQSQKKSQSQSKSQSRSQSQSRSKNGGRGRKKRTMKKDRRVKKSRKVMMRGGEPTEYSSKFPGGSQLVADLLTNHKIENKRQLEDYIFNPANNINAKMWYKELYGSDPASTMSNDEVKDAIITKLEAGDQ